MRLARRMAPRWMRQMAHRVGNPYWPGVDELWEQFAAGSVGATGALCERMEVCRDGLAFGLGGQSSRVLAASMDEPWGVELRSAGCASPLHESTTAALTLLAPGVGGDTTHIYVDGTGGSERGPAAWVFAVCLALGGVVIDVLGIVGARVCVDESSPWFLGGLTT